jgi:hypothetical protein
MIVSEGLKVLPKDRLRFIEEKKKQAKVTNRVTGNILKAKERLSDDALADLIIHNPEIFPTPTNKQIKDEIGEGKGKWKSKENRRKAMAEYYVKMRKENPDAFYGKMEATQQATTQEAVESPYLEKKEREARAMVGEYNEQISTDMDNLADIYMESAERAKDSFLGRAWTRSDLNDAIEQGIYRASVVGAQTRPIREAVPDNVVPENPQPGLNQIPDCVIPRHVRCRIAMNQNNTTCVRISPELIVSHTRR